jgi:hypothetical protein
MPTIYWHVSLAFPLMNKISGVGMTFRPVYWVKYFISWVQLGNNPIGGAHNAATQSRLQQSRLVRITNMTLMMKAGIARGKC